MSLFPLAKRERLFLKVAASEPLRPNTIFYHAYRTCIMSCSPFALFQSLIEDEAFGAYEHVWVYGSQDVLEYDTFKRYAGRSNVRFVEAGSHEHVEALATSGYLVTNAGFPSYWHKRAGQVVVNTWHGTPLKMLGMDARDFDGASIGTAQRNFLSSDYLVVPNRYTADKLFNAYSLGGYFAGCVLDVGSPRVDLVLHADSAGIRRRLEDRLGEKLEGRKVVLYAPTFRSEHGRSANTAHELMGYMAYLVRHLPDDFVVFFKVHNTIGEYFARDAAMANRLVFDEIETNELLAATDVLITDYSSICFDFLCTKRPIVLFAYDEQRYAAERGLYLDMDEMPGFRCPTVEAVVACIEGLRENKGGNPNGERALELFAYNDDGNATERVIEAIFKDAGGTAGARSPERCADGRADVLVSVDSEPDVSSMLALGLLLRSFDGAAQRVSVAVHGVHRVRRMCERACPGVHFVFADVATKAPWRKRLFDRDFLKTEYGKFFSDVSYERYYDLKRRKGFVDAIVAAALPEAERVRWFVQPDCAGASVGAGQSMRVLIVSKPSASNAGLADWARSLVEGGHEVIVASSDPDDMAWNHPFVEAGFDLVPVSAIDDACACMLDIVVGVPGQTASARQAHEKLAYHGVLTMMVDDVGVLGQEQFRCAALSKRLGEWRASSEASRRYRAVAQWRLRLFSSVNARMGSVLDLSPLEDMVDLDVSDVPDERAAWFAAEMDGVLVEGFSRIREAYFGSAAGRACIERDGRVQAAYFDWLGETGRYEALEQVAVGNLRAPEALELDLASAALARHDAGGACEHFLEYVRLARTSVDSGAQQLDAIGDELAPISSGPLKIAFLRTLLGSQDIRLLELVHDVFADDPLIAFSLARKLNHVGAYDECVELCDAAMLHYPSKSGRLETLRATASLYARKSLYRMVARERTKARSALSRKARA